MMRFTNHRLFRLSGIFWLQTIGMTLWVGAHAEETAAPAPMAVPTPTNERHAVAAVSPPKTGSSWIALTDAQVVRRALSANPTLQAAELDLKSALEQVRGEEGRYPLAVIADGSAAHNQTTQLRADDSVAPGVTRSVDFGVGLRRTFPFGMVAEMRAGHQYFNRDINAVMANPFLPANEGQISSLRASVTQPLLRGFGTTVGEVELRAAQGNREATESVLSRVRSTLVRDVLTAYYELWYATKVLEIETASRSLAREQERQTEERVATGALSTSELFTFQTRSSELTESVVLAELGIEQRSLELSQLMGEARAERTRLQATTDPEPSGAPLGVAAVTEAVAKRSIEVAELEQQLRVAKTRAEAAGDSSRPRLDAQAFVQSNGTSTEFGRSWERAGSFQWWTAQVALNLELPIDQSRRDSQLNQARLAVSKAEAQLRAAKDRIAREVSYSVASDHAAHERVQSAERTLVIAERAYEAASARFEAGQTIAITLQQAQEDLRRARLRVVRARVDGAEQRLNVDHLTGKLLERYARAR